MVTAGERNPSLAAQSSHKGFVQREMEPEEPCLTFFNRAPEATQPQSHHLHPIQPAQRIGAETRALEGAGQSSVRTCGVGGIVVVSCGICRLQNPLPRCFLNSASTLANASPHHSSWWCGPPLPPAQPQTLSGFWGSRIHSVSSMHGSDGHSDQQPENVIRPCKNSVPFFLEGVSHLSGCVGWLGRLHEEWGGRPMKTPAPDPHYKNVPSFRQASEELTLLMS